MYSEAHRQIVEIRGDHWSRQGNLGRLICSLEFDSHSGKPAFQVWLEFPVRPCNYPVPGNHTD